MFVWELVSGSGSLEITAGPAAALYWVAVLLWGLCVAYVVWRRRYGLILLTAPIVLYPALVVGLLLTACRMGDCI